MHQVTIGYKSTRSTGPDRGRLSRSMPSAWVDMEPDTAWHCMDMIIRGVPRRHLVEHLLQVPQVIQDRIQTGEMYDLIQLMEWMQIDPSATAPIAPWITAGSGRDKRKLYLYTDKFGNGTALDYVLLDESYERFIVDRDPELQAQMIAIILRPAGPSRDPASDPRVQLLSDAQCQEWLPLIRSLPESILVYITTLISATREYIRETYGHWLFTSTPSIPTGDDQEEGEQAPAAEGNGLDFGWWGAYMDVAEDGVFGTYDQVLQTDFHTVAMHMVRKVDEARRMKQQHDHALARAGIKS